VAKRDFAHVHTPVKKKSGKGHPAAAMAGISLLLTAILAFTGGYMVGDTRNSTLALQSEKEVLQTRVEGLQKHVAELEQQLASSLEREKPAAKKAAADRVGDLTFYSALPKQKVMPSPLGDTGPAAVQKHRGEDIEAYADLPPPASRVRLAATVHPVVKQGTGDTAGGAGSATASYRLQVGSFVRRSDAEVLLNRMALAGIKATVREAQVPNLGTRYRVFTASYSGMAEAEGAKALLHEKLGINGLLMRE